ncbi:MAG TPA: SH3 domain-containing protein [Anaerolineaceae bacterium]|nr:SH3 domain-containing protein [Anaerolineaceae bacterium]
MGKLNISPILCGLLLFFSFTLLMAIPVYARNSSQNAATQIATVTGTPVGVTITVKNDNDHINVRSGPGTAYEIVGVVLAGQVIPAKGRSPGGDWVLIDYPGVQGGQGWVYAVNVTINGGELPVAEPPPTPTLLYTPTINPTLAAQFVITAVPTRYPTFTPPPALIIPTFAPVSTGNQTGKVPMGMVILGIGAVGLFLGLFTLSQGR